MQPRPVLTGIDRYLTRYGIGALLYRFRGRYKAFQPFRPVSEWNSQLCPFHSSGGKALKFQNQWPRAPRRPTPAVAVLPQEGPNRAAPRRRRQPPPPLLTSKTWLPQCLGPQPQAPPLPRRCARSCSGGMTRTVGTFHGDAQAAARKRGRTRCGCRR
jgi:hypothetical protein